MKNTLTGTFNSVNKISGSFGNSLAALSFDEEYVKKRTLGHKTQSGNALDSLETASTSLFKGFESGLTDVFLKPMQGAKEEGLPGLLKGTFKGLTGFIAKPLSGFFDATSKTAEGLINSINTENKRLNRYKRPFYGVEKFFKDYSQKDGEIIEFLEK